MQAVVDTSVEVHELPAGFADRLGVEYALSVDSSHKKERGQFFTPSAIAEFMASLIQTSAKELRVLDPGCGMAILSCALIEHLANSNNQLQSIFLVAYETDPNLIRQTKKVINNLKIWVEEKGIAFRYELRTHDFVLNNAHVLNSDSGFFSEVADKFDIIISNPPYFKLSKDDPRTLAAKQVVSGQPNIYSFFMAIAAKLLTENGELVFITPRSFASGNYFKAFRNFFFSEVEIDRVHLFNSRKDTFGRDSVLQETVIIKATRKKQINIDRLADVSTSNGLKDISTPEMRSFYLRDLIDFDSTEKFFHIPSNSAEESILQLVKQWKGDLNKYNIQVSTGPVVAHRAVDFIKEQFENGKVILAPLFWMHHVSKMQFVWPLHKNGKGQYILVNDDSRSLLLPNKDYVLLRRFSSKDDSSRLIAAPYFSSFHKSEFIGVENKVNYIYRPKGNLEKEEVIGLCALLNSDLFDNYFRMFNGNVNVSATELREMSMPSLDLIKAIGQKVILSSNYAIDNINNIVNATLFAIPENLRK